MPDDAPNPLAPNETAHLLTQLVRLGAAIDKELTLMSERMTWLNLSESFIFSAFTVAVANRDKALALELLACLMPVVGFLMALLVYPALLAAHSMAKRLKETRHELELLIPVKLQIDLRASRREHFWGSVPAFVIPVMLMMVWGIILLTLIFVQWR